MLTYHNLEPYQKQEIVKQIRNKYGYLFLDTGMGKTVISLAIFDQLKKRRIVDKALVIATKHIMNNVWMQEATKWEFSKDFKFSIIHGSTYKGNAEYSRMMATEADADIHLINYEGLHWLSTHILRYSHVKWQCLFYDESTKMKSSTTKRFRAFKKIMHRFNYRYCLTGTPIPNGLEDIFGQCYVIDKGNDVQTNSITAFRNKYLVPLYHLHGRTTVYGERNGSRKTVAKKISHRVSRLKNTDHLKLPELKYHIIKLELPELSRTMYDIFEKEFYLEIEGKGIEALSQVSANMKLRQFLQGRMYDEDKNTVKLNTFKLQALKQLKLNGNCLIAYNFKFERDDLQTVTGNNTPFLDSRTTDKQAEKWITGWNNYEYKHFLVNPASAAHGLNLQAGGNNVIWYSLTYNAEHYSQLIDRLWRRGQRRTVNVYHIIFKNTIDEAVAEVLARKDKDQTRLMDDIVKYMRR